MMNYSEVLLKELEKYRNKSFIYSDFDDLAREHGANPQSTSCILLNLEKKKLLEFVCKESIGTSKIKRYKVVKGACLKPTEKENKWAEQHARRKELRAHKANKATPFGRIGEWLDNITRARLLT